MNVELFVSGWEIECCAPPPVIGASTTWTLQHVAATDPFPMHELDRVRTWRAESTRLVDGPIVVMPSHDGPPLQPGWHELRGHLSGTRHGPMPEEFPETTGTVQRVRVVSLRRTLGEPRTWHAVPGTLTMTDVRESPRWFTSDRGAKTDHTSQEGVLLDIAVPELISS